MKNNRILLTPGQMITAENKEQGVVQAFTIKRILGEGGSFCVYSVVDSYGNSGTLKEYYPYSLSMFLERADDASIITKNINTKKALERGRIRIEKSYRKIRAILSENESTRNFFVSGKLFYGVNNTLYIYYENDMIGNSFDRYLSLSDFKNLEQEKKLVNIMEIISDLAKKIDAVNNTGDGYYFFDITPYNFMVLSAPSGEPINNNTYLVDIDTITSTDEIINRTSTAVGRIETGFHSELILADMDCLRENLELAKEADAYSVMAVLFYALTGKKLNENRNEIIDCFRKAKMIKQSKILSEEQKEHLIALLVSLYEKTALNHLTNRNYRPFSCEDIIVGLDEIIRFLTRIMLNNNEDQGSGTLANKDDSVNAELMFSNMLYKYPLYDYTKGDEIRVLILGFGVYGKAAFGAAFSNGQILQENESVFSYRKLRIALVEKSIDFQKFFNEKMPGLAGFADISQDSWSDNESESLGNNIYADISYHNNIVTAKNIKDIVDRYPADYIICAMDNDDYNRTIANKISSICKGRCFIGCIQTHRMSDGDSSEYRRKVYPISPISKAEEIYSGLMRLALNYHILYDKNKHRRTNINSLKASFNDKKKDFYSYQSNFAAALNLKYKLHSLNIKWREDDRYSMAEEFSKTLQDKNAMPYLIDMEHRRWVANNLVQGYLPPESVDNKYQYDYSFMFKVNNVRVTEKTSQKYSVPLYHTAMVSSDCDTGSCIPYELDWDKDDWYDDPSYLSGLDELDKVSLLVHHYLRDNRDHYDEKCDYHFDKLDEMFKNDQELYESFKELKDLYMLVKKDIKYGAENYGYESERFISIIKARKDQSNDPDFIKMLEDGIDHLEQICSLLFVRLEYLTYKDYKSYDRLFIKNIPFILKYSDFALIQNIRDAQDNNVLWGLKNPLEFDASRIIYLEMIETDLNMTIRSVHSQMRSYVKQFSNILVFQKCRRFFDDVKLHIIIYDRDSKFDILELKNIIADECDRHLIDSKRIIVHLINKLSNLDSIVKRIIPKTESVVPINGFKKSSVFYRILRDMKTKEIFDYRDCIIHKSLNIREYMSLYDSAVMQANQAINETFDYLTMWSLFSRRYIYEGIQGYQSIEPAAIWNQTCQMINQSLRGETLLCGIVNPVINGTYDQFFSRNYRLGGVEETIREFLLTAQRYNLIANPRIIKLNDNESVEPVYSVRFNYSLDIYPDYKNGKQKDLGNKIDEVITRIINKKPFEIIQSDTENPQYFDYYIIRKSFYLDPYKSDEKNSINYNAKYIERLIDQLVANRFIIRTTEAKGDTTITRYSIENRRLLDILSKGGALLEYFIYFALKHSGEFSQVAQSVLFRWNKNDMASSINELDVCSVKGMKAMFVSAKACQKIEREMINEIYTYSSQLDAIPVLVSGHGGTDKLKTINMVKDMDNMYLICYDDFHSENIPMNGGNKLAHRLKMSAEADEKLLSEKLIDVFNNN